MTYQIALIPGDGIGNEVVPEGVRTLEALTAKYGFDVSFTSFPYSCRHYIEHGVMMPPDALDRLKSFDAILLGAIGGMILSGIIGLFTGAVVLALGYVLFRVWIYGVPAGNANTQTEQTSA